MFADSILPRRRWDVGQFSIDPPAWDGGGTRSSRESCVLRPMLISAYDPIQLRLDGEGDGKLEGAIRHFGDPIQFVWMVKEIARAIGRANLIHHPGKLDGAWDAFFVPY